MVVKNQLALPTKSNQTKIKKQFFHSLGSLKLNKKFIHSINLIKKPKFCFVAPQFRCVDFKQFWKRNLDDENNSIPWI